MRCWEGRAGRGRRCRRPSRASLILAGGSLALPGGVMTARSLVVGTASEGVARGVLARAGGRPRRGGGEVGERRCVGTACRVGGTEGHPDHGQKGHDGQESKSELDGSTHICLPLHRPGTNSSGGGRIPPGMAGGTTGRFFRILLRSAASSGILRALGPPAGHVRRDRIPPASGLRIPRNAVERNLPPAAGRVNATDVPRGAAFFRKRNTSSGRPRARRRSGEDDPPGVLAARADEPRQQ